MSALLPSLLLLTLALPATAPPASPPSSQSDTVSILVPADPANRLLSVEAVKPSPTGWERIEVPLEGSVETTLERVRITTGGPALVEPVYRLAAPQDEPLFDDQWALENTGQTGGALDADVDARAAWAVADGSGVVVAVIDSGVESTHVEIDDRIWSNPGEILNGLDDEGNGFVDDVAGWDFVDRDNDPGPVGNGPDEAHATMVAGIVAAEVNGVGITGVAPGAIVMNLRACHQGECSSLDVADAIFYAVAQGADIVNLSLGSAQVEDPPMEQAIEWARINGVLVVAAAGNANADIDDLGGSLVFIPAGLPQSNILSVAASDHFDQLADFSGLGSNWGPQSVDVAAPGEAILTLGAAGEGDYVLGSGTSFASPIAAGVAALLLSHDPGAGPEELIARIEGFSDTVAGLSGLIGYGRVNAGTTLTRRFIDTASSVFVDAIDWLADEEITQGCNPPENHRYCPGAEVSRGEMAVFLSRAFRLPPAGTDYFTDDTGQFYEGAANRLAEAGLTVGCGDRTYCGERDISREEMAAMLARALSLPATNDDHFIDDEGSIFENAINKIAEAGITVGCNPPDNDRYCPGDDVTRGQMAAFIKRAVALLG